MRDQRFFSNIPSIPWRTYATTSHTHTRISFHVMPGHFIPRVRVRVRAARVLLPTSYHAHFWKCDWWFACLSGLLSAQNIIWVWNSAYMEEQHMIRSKRQCLLCRIPLFWRFVLRLETVVFRTKLLVRVIFSMDCSTETDEHDVKCTYFVYIRNWIIE